MACAADVMNGRGAALVQADGQQRHRRDEAAPQAAGMQNAAICTGFGAYLTESAVKDGAFMPGARDVLRAHYRDALVAAMAQEDRQDASVLDAPLSPAKSPALPHEQVQ